MHGWLTLVCCVVLCVCMGCSILVTIGRSKLMIVCQNCALGMGGVVEV